MAEWTIPGGGVEPDEDGEQTAAREALEEVRGRGRGNVCVNFSHLWV